MRSHLTFVVPLMAVAAVMALLRPGVRFEPPVFDEAAAQAEVTGISDGGDGAADAVAGAAGTGGDAGGDASTQSAVLRSAVPPPAAVNDTLPIGGTPERSRDRDWRSREREFRRY